MGGTVGWLLNGTVALSVQRQPLLLAETGAPLLLQWLGLVGGVSTVCCASGCGWGW